jgi:hypothetical protein
VPPKLKPNAPMGSETACDKTRELRLELVELQETLGELEIAALHSGKVVLLRYIAQRIREIAESLCELDRTSRNHDPIVLAAF